ncbi:MAG: beta-propeller domain-containing protein [Acutalibacteraceae bacterium]
MKNNEKYEFIRDKLTENPTELPPSLERDKIVSLLPSEVSGSKIKKFPSKKALTLAASLAVFILSVLLVGVFSSPLKGNNASAPKTTVPETALNPTGNDSQGEENGDYSDIIEYFLSLEERAADYYYGDVIMGYAPLPEGDINSAPTYAASEESFIKGEASDYVEGSSASPAHGQTNTQVDNVDEADIIKNDGTYLYIVRNRSVLIYRAADLKLMSEIEIEQGENEDVSLSDIYITSDRLVIMATVYEIPENDEIYFSYYFRNDAETKCFVYDIGNREKPKQLFTHTQDGDCMTTRMVGNTLYTVSQFVVSPKYNEEEKDLAERCIPKINGKKISRNKIDFSDKNTDSVYIVVSSCDIKSGSGAGYAYFGRFYEAYCTEKTLYISSVISCYDDETSKELGLDEGTYTNIYAVSLSPDDISFKNKGYVRGEFLNQFSMDEYGGYFRCAVTDYDNDWNAISSVKILDENFKEVSSIYNLAENEEIKAVRFMGEVAYVVTFENTDPLFVLDLSGPHNPKKDGEVKLPGFSAYLHPLDENHIVGVGFGGDENGTDYSVKLTVFDISDKKHPEISSEYKINNASTETNYNFKAFLYYPEKNIIGVPVEKDTDTGIKQKYILFKVENGKLSLVNEYLHDYVKYDYVIYDYFPDKIVEYGDETVTEEEYIPEFFRGTYIDDTLYTISEKKICAFDIDSAEKICETETGK